MFEVGKEVVAIRDHSAKKFLKGDTFILKGIKQGCCKRCSMVLDIGIRPTNDAVSHCPICGHSEPTKIGWFDSSSFVPLDDISISASEVYRILLYLLHSS